jgi:hypothetical protein
VRACTEKVEEEEEETAAPVTSGCDEPAFSQCIERKLIAPDSVPP